MKLNKIITIAIINGLTLLIFASLLASCQKMSINHKGLFTSFSKNTGRTIASTPNSLEKHFDIKQIYIYCSVNDKNTEKCYEKNLKVVLKHFQNKNGSLSKEDQQDLINTLNYNVTKNNTESLAKTMLDSMDVHIKQLTSKRENFCRINSKFYIKRCLNQYVEKDTMSVLNAYQGHNREMNGHEYLYLKNKIKKQFYSFLDVSYDKLKNEEKKS